MNNEEDIDVLMEKALADFQVSLDAATAKCLTNALKAMEEDVPGEEDRSDD